MVIGLHRVERSGSGEPLWLAGFAFSDGVPGVIVVEDAPTSTFEGRHAGCRRTSSLQFVFALKDPPMYRCGGFPSLWGIMTSNVYKVLAFPV